MHRSSKVILSTVVAFALIGLWLKMTAPNPLPDAAQIGQQLTSAASSAENKDAGGVMSIISIDYQDSNGDNPEQLNLLLRRAFQNVQNLTVDLSTINVKVTDDTAESACYIDIKADGAQEFNQPVTLQWKKETTHRYLIFPVQVWKVVHSNFVGSLPDPG